MSASISRHRLFELLSLAAQAAQPAICDSRCVLHQRETTWSHWGHVCVGELYKYNLEGSQTPHKSHPLSSFFVDLCRRQASQFKYQPTLLSLFTTGWDQVGVYAALEFLRELEL